MLSLFDDNRLTPEGFRQDLFMVSKPHFFYKLTVRLTENEPVQDLPFLNQISP